MDVILAHITLENIKLQFRTNLTNYVTNPNDNHTGQKRFAVLHNPHKTEFDVKLRMIGARSGGQVVNINNARPRGLTTLVY